MKVTHLRGPPSDGWTTNMCQRNPMNKVMKFFTPRCSIKTNNSMLMDKNGICAPSIMKHCHLANDHAKFYPSPIISCRKHISSAGKSRYCSDCSEPPYNEGFTQKKEHSLTSFRDNILCKMIHSLLLLLSLNMLRLVSILDEPFSSELMGITDNGSQSISGELIILALPAIVGQAIEPLSQLMETAYIGRLGAVDLASAAVSVSIFNVISKLFNIPLLSVTTSFVAEDISKHLSRESISDRVSQEENGREIPERMQLPSVSTALLLASGIGIIEALALYFGAGLFLNMMGISSASPMHGPSQRFLSLRALGAPAVVVSLAVQGVFRGFKDTSTPLLCLGVGNFSSVFLLPIFMYYFRLGITGAAIATVISQYTLTLLLIWFLNKRAVLLPPKKGDLQFGGYIKSGGFLIGRTLSVLVTLTLGTSMAARQGPLAMAAHQICLQVWLGVSLLSDALAVSGQALIARAFSKGDYERVKEITYWVLKAGVFTGVSSAVVLSMCFGSLAQFFTKDAEVLGIVSSGVLFVSASQPINALAFVFDGLHYGVSDFSYAAYSMMFVGAISSAFLLYAPSIFGLPGVWSGLALFMSLRMAAGFVRLGSKTGPWWFLWDLPKTEVTG